MFSCVTSKICKQNTLFKTPLVSHKNKQLVKKDILKQNMSAEAFPKSKDENASATPAVFAKVRIFATPQTPQVAISPLRLSIARANHSKCRLFTILHSATFPPSRSIKRLASFSRHKSPSRYRATGFTSALFIRKQTAFELGASRTR